MSISRPTLQIPTQILTPELYYNNEQIKTSTSFDIQDRVSQGITKTFTADVEQFGVETEGYIVDTNGQPYVHHNKKFIATNVIDNDLANRISTYSSSEEEILALFHHHAKTQNIGTVDHIKFSQELYKPGTEISYTRGFNAHEFFDKYLESLHAVNNMLGFQQKSLYLGGNNPLPSGNINNFSNTYYEYLFKERDGGHIGDFRGTGLQLHTLTQNYESALYIFNHIRYIMPIFVALSANSPIHQGRYKGNLSERLANKYEVFQEKTGIPQKIDTDFLHTLQSWINNGLNTVTPYYNLVRYPRVDIKTIENCSMDSIHDIRLVVALIDLHFAIASKLEQHYITQKPLPETIFGHSESIQTNNTKEIQNEKNHLDAQVYKAIREGSQAKIIIGENSRTLESLVTFLLERTQDIPSRIPQSLAKKFGLADTNFSHTVLMELLTAGNLAEQALQNLGIRKNNTNILIPKQDILQLIQHQSQITRSQLTILFNH